MKQDHKHSSDTSKQKKTGGLVKNALLDLRH
jgi:hypothetical protein